MAKRLILMCGIPGAGKSTFIKNHIASDGIIISRDAIRFDMLKSNEDYFSKENEVWDEYVKALKKAIKCEWYTDVVADATHLNARARNKILNAISDVLNEVEVYVLYVDVDLETALKQNSQRTGRALVPESAIKNMYASLQIPNKAEGYRRFGYIEENIILFKKER